VTLDVPIEAAGERLDRFLSNAAGISRSQVGVRIAAGDVVVNGKLPHKAGLQLRGGERIELTIPPPPPSEAIPEDIPVDVIYEDADLIVVNKAAHMVVHPSPGHESGTLVNALLHKFSVLAQSAPGEDGRPRPGIVHRLDRGTSGLLVVARTAAAHTALSRQLADRTLSRTYLAIVHGHKLDGEGTFDTLHGRHPKNRKRFSTRVEKGKRAVTHWTVLARSSATSLVECKLETGRTHQLRVHFSDYGHPICGDPTYGGIRKIHGREGAGVRKLERQALHAWKLAFIHPVTQKLVTFEAPPPPDMAYAIEILYDGLPAI
jgi:23S rRNA pseudouridine1911/1915/1917 synthase